MDHYFVTEAIGSGKTTLAGTLSQILQRKVISLDALFFDLGSPVHRKKKDPLQRDKELLNHIADKSIIFEGWNAGDWLDPLYRCVSLVVIVDTPLELRLERIENRFHRRKAGLEFDPFPHGDMKHLNNLFKWTEMFDADQTENEIRKHCFPECVFLEMMDLEKSLTKSPKSIQLITRSGAPRNS